MTTPTATAVAFAAMVQEVEQARFERMYPMLGKPVFTATGGGKFDRIVQQDMDRDGHPTMYGRQVHAFVERETGLVFKADGWKRPAKGARGDASTDEGMADLRDRLTTATGYLYR